MIDFHKLDFEKQLKKNNIKTCHIYHDAEIILEYSRNEVFTRDIIPINSCTKSITSALVGICLEQGYFDHVQQAFLPLLKHESPSPINPAMEGITIHQLLTMTSGIEWNEQEEWHMFKESFNENVLDTILAKEVTDGLSKNMNYSSVDSYLLSALIQQVSGKTTEEFAIDYLFTPLGITEFEWPEKQGINLGSHGMCMKASDLLKIGIMYLNDGIYNDKQVLASSWIEASRKPYSKATRIQGHYGYHWWVMEESISATQSIDYFFAMGYGGQVIIVVPPLKLVTVITRNIDKNSTRSIELFRKYIFKEFI